MVIRTANKSLDLKEAIPALKATDQLFCSRHVWNPFDIKKVKQSLYRPGQVLGVPGSLDSQISRQSAHEPAAFTPKELFMGRISVRA